jgi:hypothetical protein
MAADADAQRWRGGTRSESLDGAAIFINVTKVRKLN